MLNQALSPVFSYFLLPVGNHLRPETDADRDIATLKERLTGKAIKHPLLEKELMELAKDLDDLNLTRNLLHSREDRENAQKLAAGLAKLINDKILPFLIQIDSLTSRQAGGQKYQLIDKKVADDIESQAEAIKAEAGELKGLYKKSPALWKDTAWKNLMVLIGGLTLLALGHGIIGLTMGAAALWVLYEGHYNYRKEIFEKGVKLVAKLDTRAQEQDAYITKLHAKKAEIEGAEAKAQAEKAVAEAAIAKAQSERSVQLVSSLAQGYAAVEKRLEYLEGKQKTAPKPRKVTILKSTQNKYQFHSAHPDKLKVE